jgi:large subunit ribosomal protein L30
MPKSDLEKAKRLRLTWVKSCIGYSQRHKGTIKALGLRKLGDSVEHDNTPSIRGMANKVSHLVDLEALKK